MFRIDAAEEPAQRSGKSGPPATEESSGKVAGPCCRKTRKDGGGRRVRDGRRRVIAERKIVAVRSRLRKRGRVGLPANTFAPTARVGDALPQMRQDGGCPQRDEPRAVSREIMRAAPQPWRAAASRVADI